MENNIMYQLPNHIVWSYTDTKSIYQLLNNDKLVHLFVAMNDLINPRGVCSFTVGGLLDTCNLPDNKENVKIFKDMLIELYKLQLFTIVNGIDIKTIRKSTWLSISPNWFVIKNDKRSEFFILYRHELDRIMSYNSQGVNNYKLLIYYCYLVSRMYNRRNYTNVEGKEVKATIDMDRAETCHPSFMEMSNHLNIDDNTLTKYNDILIELDLIRLKSPGYKKKEEFGKVDVRRSSNTYVLYRNEHWQEELNYSVEGYIASETKEGWTFIDDEVAEKLIDQKRVLSNTINRLQYLKDTKGITDEQEQQLQDCIDKRNSMGEKQDESDDVVEGYFGRPRNRTIDMETGEIAEEPANNVLVGRGSKSFTDDKEVMAGFSFHEDSTDKKVMAIDTFHEDGTITSIEDIINDSKFTKIIQMFAQKHNKKINSIIAFLEDLEDYFVSDDFIGLSKTKQYEEFNEILKINESDIDDITNTDSNINYLIG